MRILMILAIALLFGHSKTYNHVDNNYSTSDIEHGWMFYDENKKDNVNKELEPTEKDSLEAKLLFELLKEIKNVKAEVEQMKLYINPNAPKKIRCTDGTFDWSNSRKECFDIPVITEGRNIPALYKWMKDPTEENAATWLGVQSALFNQATRMGYSLRFAYLNGGSDVYETSTIHTEPTYGPTNSIQRYNLRIKLLNNFSDTLGTAIFLGDTKELEQKIGPEKISRLIFDKSLLINPFIVFKDQLTKDSYDYYFEVVSTNNELKRAYLNATKQVLPDMFEKYNIRKTPTVMAILKKDDGTIKNSVITKGFVSKDRLMDGLTQFAIFNNLIHPKQLNVDSQWKINHE